MYDVYYKGVKVGTRIEPFLYNTSDGISLDLHDELKPCLCGNRPVLIRDGVLELRFGVFCENPNCPKCPTHYSYHWSWFNNATRAIDEWNKIIDKEE